ncbi:unnamed protein product [Heligmosomoides polygyrus]|uniref:Uncharacterized protein n=1 Tax=Heligmosomoides polygyrus TaxID=6339 RepID=A0A183G9E9_HELPZ|nr:unnamed protein product [Heligmosomoides polygyrus]
MTLKTRCDAKNVLRCFLVDDVAAESIDDVVDDVGDVGDGLSCRSVGDSSPKYNIGLTGNTSCARKKTPPKVVSVGTSARSALV